MFLTLGQASWKVQKRQLLVDHLKQLLVSLAKSQVSLAILPLDPRLTTSVISQVKSTCQTTIHEMWSFAWLSLFLKILVNIFGIDILLRFIRDVQRVSRFSADSGFMWQSLKLLRTSNGGTGYYCDRPLQSVGSQWWNRYILGTEMLLVFFLVTDLVFDSACAELARAILFGHFGMPDSVVWIFQAQSFQSLRHSFDENLATALIRCFFW